MNRVVTDHDFDADLKLFRADLKKYRNETVDVLALVRGLQNEDAPAADNSMRNLHARLDGLAEYVSLAHQRMPRHEHRMEAWYCICEVNEMIDYLQGKDTPPPNKGNSA